MAGSEPQVGIIMGSVSDGRVMVQAADTLDQFGVAHEDQVVSAHRTPARLSEYARHARDAGIKVIIAGAGGAAHLPGMIASFTTLPVIGVPILVYNDKGPAGKTSAFGGLDSLLSISEMPAGSPVASVGVNKAANAAIYAVKILAVSTPGLRDRLVQFKNKRRDGVVRESDRMMGLGLRKYLDSTQPA